MVYFVVILLFLAAFYVIGSAGLGWLPLLGYCNDAERVNMVLPDLIYCYLERKQLTAEYNSKQDLHEIVEQMGERQHRS